MMENTAMHFPVFERRCVFSLLFVQIRWGVSLLMDWYHGGGGGGGGGGGFLHIRLHVYTSEAG
jgi:hypothetical protein